MNPGLTGILASQKMVEVTGNNIANVNTPGYSRQVAIQSPAMAIQQRGLYVGQGVKVKEVTREYDRFISGQLMDQNNTMGREDSKSRPLAELERIFGIGSDSLANEIESFFGSWHDLAENPSGSVERERVLYHGENLVDAFAFKQSELVRITQNINYTLEAEVNGINLRLQEVAHLNAEIMARETLGHVAHVEHDKRDLLINELSGIMGVHVYDSGHGQVGLQLPGGLPLVQGANAVAFQGHYDGDRLAFTIKTGDVVLPAEKHNFGGMFSGLLQMRDEFIPAMARETGGLLHKLATEVNTLHAGGYGLDGVSGRDFFAIDAETGAVSMPLMPTGHVAAGGQEGGAPGDNENALAIHRLMGERIGGETFTEHYSRITSLVGTEARRNIMSRDAARDTMTQLENLRESIVGVSIEEEMVNLIMFQKGFEAASKYIGTIDEMLGTIIGMKR